MTDVIDELIAAIDDGIIGADYEFPAGTEAGISIHYDDAGMREQLKAALKRAGVTVEGKNSDSERLDFLVKNNNFELSYQGGWGDDDPYWAVHRVNGGRNDREWVLIGKGDTPAEAIDSARIFVEMEK
jgi:hypothetical protein